MRDFDCLALNSLKIYCMKNWIWILLLFVGQILAAQSKITYIKMERTPCFGVCPAYTIEIKSNGVCVYKGIKDAVYDGKIIGKLSASEWKKLQTKYQKYNFLKLPSSYKVHYTMIVNGKTKTIKNANEGPEFLMELCQDLTALHGNKIKWDKKTFVKNKPGTPYKQEFPQEVYTDQAGDESPQVAEARVEDVVQQDKDYVVVEQMPEFPGGQDAMMQFLREKLTYPAQARELGIQGKVICSFVVDKSGEIRNVTVLRGIGYGCDQEAIRVIKAMPAWKPGRQSGQVVNVKYNIPISFKLN